MKKLVKTKSANRLPEVARSEREGQFYLLAGCRVKHETHESPVLDLGPQLTAPFDLP